MNDEQTTVEIDYAQTSINRNRLPFAHHIPKYVTYLGILAFCLLAFTCYMLLWWYIKCERTWPSFSWIISVLLLLTLLGGVSGYRQLVKRETSKEPSLLAYMGFGSGILVVAFMLVMVFDDSIFEMTIYEANSSYEMGMRRVCKANMRGIGYAIAIYQQDFGEPPESIDVLFRTDPTGIKQTICPSFQGNANAYRLIKQCPPNKDGLVPVLIEDPSNHYCEGGNVLYDDFMTVEFLDKPELDALIQSATFE